MCSHRCPTPAPRIAARRWGDGTAFAEIARRVLEETDAHVLWFSERGHRPSASVEACHAVSLGFDLFSRSFLLPLLVCNDSGP